MYKIISKNLKVIFVLFLLAFALTANAFAQKAEFEKLTSGLGKEVKLPEDQGLIGRDRTGCLQIDNRIYNAESWNKMFDFEQCAKTFTRDQFDFKKLTLIGYNAGGDCHMQLDLKLYRDDEKKLYTMVMKNIWGGCRAGGWRHGLIALDKIPADYKFRFVEYLVEDFDDRYIREKSDSDATWTADGKQVIDVPIAVPKP